MIYDKLTSIFDRFLGDSKRECDDKGQIQYNCPECSLSSYSLDGDGKYNLELNFQKGVFKCWACADTNSMSGKLSKLIKLYGNEELYNQYRKEINSLRDSKLFSLFEDDEKIHKCFDCEVLLPKGCKSLTKNTYQAKEALEYLKSRGIGSDIIKNYNLLYTSFNVEETKFIKKIIIPSYDKFGNLTYWVGRRYPEDNKFGTKYVNPNVEKMSLIFNEDRLNWDGDIRLVEGPFDHIVVPNSVPMLGKELNENFLLYKELFKKANGTITIFLDAEAIEDTKKIFKLLNVGSLKGKIKYVTYKSFENISLPFKELDPSKIHEKFGKNGIISALRDTSTFHELELV